MCLPPDIQRERYNGGVSKAPAQKALFDFLLWDLLSLLKCLIGFINFYHSLDSYQLGGEHVKWEGDEGQLQGDFGCCQKVCDIFQFIQCKKNGALSSQPGFLLSSIKDSGVFMMYLLFFSDNWVFVF